MIFSRQNAACGSVFKMSLIKICYRSFSIKIVLIINLNSIFAALNFRMNIYRHLHEYTSPEPLALSLGMFDGVHRGHQSIISEINKVAAQKNLSSAILTFWPHPRLAFNPDENLKLLNTIDEKTALLNTAGIKHLFIQAFDEPFRNLTGEEFVREILVKKLNVKYLIVGYDHVFGKNRSGNFELLQQLAPELGFEVEKMEAVNLHNYSISSTKIREALAIGDITSANEMLGYPYPLSGTVVDGKKLGRTIGYPTANIAADSTKLLPKKGAYIVEVEVKDTRYAGMLSVGTNPTVGGETLTVEVYILNFNEDIYGTNITVRFRDFLHEEIKFESVEQLVERLDEDKKQTQEYFENLPLS